jgi:hypothetical protein
MAANQGIVRLVPFRRGERLGKAHGPTSEPYDWRPSAIKHAIATERGDLRPRSEDPGEIQGVSSGKNDKFPALFQDGNSLPEVNPTNNPTLRRVRSVMGVTRTGPAA